MTISPLRLATAVSQWIIAACLLVLVLAEYGVPFAAGFYYASEYRRLAAECDHAMHDEVTLRAGTTAATQAPALVLSGVVGLTVCHEYDKLRKRMLTLGVTEDRLALLGLEALESELIPVARMVEPHKMDRF
jgi:hypothetical protein